MSSKTHNKNKIGLERREFLKLSASGIAVYLSGCAPEVLVPAPGGIDPDTRVYRQHDRS